jgi:hypothetical protein
MTNRIARIAGIAGLLAVAALLAAACGDDSGGGTADGGQPAVEITAAGECTLSGDDVATGIIDFSITNGSDEPLVVVFLQIDEGQTLEDVQEAFDPPFDVRNPPDLTTYAARTTAGVPPGEEAVDDLALTEPGEYAAACVTDSPEGLGVLASGSLSVSA